MRPRAVFMYNRHNIVSGVWNWQHVATCCRQEEALCVCTLEEETQEW